MLNRARVERKMTDKQCIIKLITILSKGKNRLDIELDIKHYEIFDRIRIDYDGDYELYQSNDSYTAPSGCMPRLIENMIKSILEEKLLNG